METIARIKTPKRVCKVVHFVDSLGKDAYQLWDGNRRRHWRIYTSADGAVKAMVQTAASDYLMPNLFNQV